MASGPAQGPPGAPLPERSPIAPADDAATPRKGARSLKDITWSRILNSQNVKNANSPEHRASPGFSRLDPSPPAPDPAPDPPVEDAGPHDDEPEPHPGGQEPETVPAPVQNAENIGEEEEEPAVEIEPGPITGAPIKEREIVLDDDFMEDDTTVAEPIVSEEIEPDLIDPPEPKLDKGEELDRNDPELDELPNDRESMIEKLSTIIGGDVDATFKNVIEPQLNQTFGNTKKAFSNKEFWDLQTKPLVDFAVNALRWEEDYGFVRRTVVPKLADLSLFLGQVKRRKWPPI
jgi:hypothetical protein